MIPDPIRDPHQRYLTRDEIARAARPPWEEWDQSTCDLILSMIRTGMTIEDIATEFGCDRWRIEVVRLGKFQFANGDFQNPIPKNHVSRKQGEGRKVVCTPKEIDEICERVRQGERQTALAKEFGVSQSTIGLYVKKRGVVREFRTLDGTPVVDEFASKVRSRLFRLDPQDHARYKEWLADMQAHYDSGNYSKAQSIVLASKKWDCCRDLFDTYDVSAFDPTLKKDERSEVPHDAIVQKAMAEGDINQAVAKDVRCEGRELPYRENIQWAARTAGNFRRTGQQPDSCPNDTAYWLYLQAIDDPKEFMSKMSAVESKMLSSKDADLNQAFARRSIDEIDAILATFE